MSNNDVNLSKLVFLSDCTPVYSILGSPGKITQITLQRLNGGIQLTWYPPANSNEIPIDSYSIRYGKTSDPPDLINGYVSTSLPTVTISGLLNGVSYGFWISAANRYGEGVLSDQQNLDPGVAPEPITLVRRAYHSTTSIPSDADPQKVGIEFVPPLNYNGRAPSTYTIKYSLLNVQGAPVTTITTPVNQLSLLNELMVDISNNVIYNTNGYRGNYVRREIDISNTIPPGVYVFTVYSTNVYGTSTDSLQNVTIQLGTGVPRFIAPTLTLPSDNIISTTPGDNTITFKWNQTSLPEATSVNGVGWKYRIQYTDNLNYWYYPNRPLSGGILYDNIDISYDNTIVPGTGICTIDISKNVLNGRRYYVRYCIVNPVGDTSQYTLSNDSNVNITSTIPGKLPNPPDILNSNVGDRLVNLYFSWTNFPPGLDRTGGYPILDYKIERYERSSVGGIEVQGLDTTFYNIIGPFFTDVNSIRRNGTQYEYRVYSRTAIGYSSFYTSVVTIPVRQCDIVYNVTSTIDVNKITLNWQPPTNLEPGMPIVQYYIEYRIFDKYTNKNVNDMMAIVVNDDLWSSLTTTVRSVYTPNAALSYTITDLINYEVYVFRIAAVTQDSIRRKLVGLIQVIGSNSPYLPNPVIIGKVPTKIIDDINFINGDKQINITWSSDDILNTSQIINFIVEYRIYGSSDTAITLKYVYNSSVSYYTATRVYYSINIKGLSNSINNITNSHSYEVILYSENTVGYTNSVDKLRLTDLTVSLYDRIYDTYESLTKLPRYVRPGAVPSVLYI
jgi:hypothetical protein